MTFYASSLLWFMGASVVAQGFLLFFLCGPLSHIHLRINISQRVKVITSTNTWYHRSAKEHIPLKFQLYSSFKTQRRNDCTKSGSRVLTFPYLSQQLNKKTCVLLLHPVHSMLSVKQKNCECKFHYFLVYLYSKLKPILQIQLVS